MLKPPETEVIVVIKLTGEWAKILERRCNGLDANLVAKGMLIKALEEFDKSK